MKLAVEIAGRTFSVEVTGPVVRVGDRVSTARLERVAGTPLWLLTDGATVRTYALVKRREGWTVQWRGEWWEASVGDARGAPGRTSAASEPAGGPWVVRAPMPGLVLRVEVAVGQGLAAGAGLVVLEAMKMENEIRAARAGTVSAVLVESGQAVEKGAALIELHPQG